MKTYMVGGAVRDRLLGLPVRDKDWVVVGSSAAEMLAAGFTQVGSDFPVFLHPETKEEHALARTERKTAPGYKGFVVHADRNVTLREDLSRRDLTMNAIAIDEAGDFADPFGGRSDIEAKLFRHVSEAFREDPVRILRVARFAARFVDFTVAPETMSLMRSMVDSGEVDSLVSERVWQELAKGLMEVAPARMLDVLLECGALARILPEVAALKGVGQPIQHPENCTLEHVRLVLTEAARAGARLGVRFACLVHDLGKATTPANVLPRHLGHEGRSEKLVRHVCLRLRVPSDIHGLAAMVAREHSNVHGSLNLDGAALVRLMERCDAFRKPGRFREALLACEFDARGRLGLSERPYPQRKRLEESLKAALRADTHEAAARMLALGRTGEDIGREIHGVRARAVQAAQRSTAVMA